MKKKMGKKRIEYTFNSYQSHIDNIRCYEGRQYPKTSICDFCGIRQEVNGEKRQKERECSRPL